tara:strand:+ start:2062 stop:4317 length:2256 start_codon:yes stop_codon:yes gene_type:complete
MDKISENLFAKIRGRFPSVTIGDADGVVTDDPKTARYYDFDFKEGEKILGKVSIAINEQDGVIVTYNDSFITDQADQTKENWYNFLKELRVFAKKNMMNFDIRDITKSNLDKRDYAHLTKNSSGDKTMSESTMYGTSRTSYEDVDKARLVLKHTQAVNPEVAGSRTQHVHSIYIESDNGERFKYPFRHLNGARALARHVSEGGHLYDEFGKHIVSLSEELSKLRQFKTYMNRSAVMAEGLKGYVNAVNERLETVKKECLKLQREAYYKNAIENYKQEVLEDVPEEVSNSWIDELTIRSFNEELKSVFPYVYKLINDSKKVEELGPEDLLSEKTDQSDIEGEIDWEFTGDDGETAPGTISYTAHADGDNVRVDPKSIQGGVDDENNPGRITSHDFDDGPNAWPIKDDIQDIMQQATIDAGNKMAARDNERDPGHRSYKAQEGHGSNVDEFLTKIANDNDPYELIDQGQRGKHGPEIEKAIQDMYDDVSVEHGLHPDDDHEEIYNRMIDDIESEYGTSEELEPQAFDPVAEYEKAISYIVGEAENSLLDGDEETKSQAISKINELVADHFPAGVNGANAISSLAGIIDDPKLQEMFRKIGQKDSDINVTPLVMKWIEAKAPEVIDQIQLGSPDDADHTADTEVPAEAAPLDHPDKGQYFDPKILKKIVKAKGKERDDKKDDGKKPSERLEELIKSYYDYTTNRFPKGETAVLTSVEKEFGEKSIPYAEKMIDKLFHNQDDEMSRVKHLAGIPQ